MKHLTSLALFACFSLCVVLTPSSVFAKIELFSSDPPTVVMIEQSFTLQVTLSGVDANSTYFIRGVFYKPDSSEYFGYTKNAEGNWQNSPSDVQSFFKVQGNGTYNITFKPDNSSSQLDINQPYLFKIGRYTEAGSLTWSEQTPKSITFSQAVVEVTSSPTPTVTQGSTQSPPPSPTPPPTPLVENTVVLSEIMACPTADSEWVELYNASETQAVSLDGWKLKDSSSSSGLTLSGQISPKSYFVHSLNSSVFNNSGDAVKLINAQGTEVDTMSYTDCESNTSLILVDKSWRYTTTPTKLQANTYTAPTSTSANTPTPTKISLVTNETQQNSELAMTKESENSPESRPEYQETITTFPTLSMPSLTPIPNDPTVLEISDSPDDEILDEPARNPKLPFFIGGSSYILCAALLAQKWYNLLSN